MPNKSAFSTLTYGLGCRAESNLVFVCWFGQSTNQLR